MRSHPHDLAEVELPRTEGAKQIRECPETSGFEQRRQTDPTPGHCLNTGEETRGEQGVTPQLKEIRGRVDGLDPQDLAPDLCEACLEIIQRLQTRAFRPLLGS